MSDKKESIVTDNTTVQEKWNRSANNRLTHLPPLPTPEEQRQTGVTQSGDVGPLGPGHESVPVSPALSGIGFSSSPDIRISTGEASFLLSTSVESYERPSRISAPRMCSHSSSSQVMAPNAFQRLAVMGLTGDPLDKLPALPAPGDLGSYGYPGKKSDGRKSDTKFSTRSRYRFHRCLCGWATFIALTVAAGAITTIILAIFMDENDNGCGTVRILLIITSVLTLFIVGLEWTRSWLWREPNLSKKYAENAPDAVRAGQQYEITIPRAATTLPAISLDPRPYMTYVSSSNTEPYGGLVNISTQRRLYDVPQFVSALVLVILYCTITVCIVITLVTSALDMRCGTVAHVGLTIGLLLAVSVVIRIITCCLSDACKGICHRTVTSLAKSGQEAVPMVAINQLNYLLPGLGQNQTSTRNSHFQGQHPAALLHNLATSVDSTQQLSIIQPMPVRFSGPAV